MLKVGEFPKDASVSSLSSILEVNVPDGYYLSVRACEGILRRSGERGKPLDPLLKQALLNTIVFTQSKTTPKTAECPSAPIIPSKPSPDEWEQGGGNVPLVLVPCKGDVGIANGGAGKKAGSVAFSKEVSPTLKAGASGLQAPVVAIPYKFPIVCRATQQSNAETMVDCCPTLTSAAGTSGNNQPIVAIPHTVLSIGADCYNGKVTGNKSMTLCAAKSDAHHLPCALIPYTLKIRSGCEGGGKGALIQEDKSATLSCNNDQTLFVPTQTENGEVIYLARKLTPTECASLQGFEKDWCALVPHKDAAEYKMWGNGMAFPCMLYIMEGVQEVLAERYLDDLFGGDASGHG